MKTTIVSMALATTLAVAAGTAGADSLRDQARTMFSAVPQYPPVIDGNELTEDKVELGRMLFFEPRLSASHLISCNTCHNVGMGGHDYLPTSIGHGWQKGPRNAPTVYNAVFNAAQFWDGRAADLAEQAKGPVQAGVEMSSTPERVVATLKSMPAYVRQFEAAFPGQEDPVTFDNMATAIEAFEATLITPDARFDKYLRGDNTALNEQEKEGLALFMNKGCAACHGGVNFGGQGYFPFGLVTKPGAEILPAGDKGRFAVTETASDQYVFRAAPLRNIELTAPYFHSGAVWSLEEAVAVMGTAQLGTELADDEVHSIVAFLKTLTGQIPEIRYPVLPPSTDTTPRPAPMTR
ncbi:cytochrome-c peroxidase [Marinobacter lutaoensis]|jgi:cytochrome c peroxidase|uniref:Cytochrome C peroxidase n=1 Tax=Marinobacter lutaoensis TaxID=135739 RepID=A0A1V2DV38_9GAMM|nr:cytochrome-c peroxidase [Marinobacter lutaoensis]MBE01986.1 cytochrome C peroxidase [Marinobacter sp.]NVD36371.1 cytochrome-c peroxidase [Marinobacter lutaoensis]ONF44508.1 cytochrome C peroxidase [Marinobacter lutaoensis]|tara:strand:+ start:98 stop:1147 length:1050 start_codon:yes stop_codon:yes gene_type:complete